MSGLSAGEMVIRLLLAGVAGALVGCERETRGRPAGLRTTILACTASAAAMVFSEALASWTASLDRTGLVREDVSRIPAGVLTGMGFLGGGTILRYGGGIRGVTTAASLWFVTVLGLAFGGGEFVLGFLGVGVALATLHLLPFLEERLPHDEFRTLEVTVRPEALGEAELRREIERLGARVTKMKVGYDLENGRKTLACELQLDRSQASEISRQTIAALKDRPGVLRLEWS